MKLKPFTKQEIDSYSVWAVLKYETLASTEETQFQLKTIISIRGCET